MSGFNTIETFFEISITPEDLRRLAESFEYHEKNCLPGQVIRMKIDHKHCLVHNPQTPKSLFPMKETRIPSKATHEELKRAFEAQQ